MRTLSLILMFLGLGTSLQAQKLNEGEIENFREKVVEKVSSVKSLQADFTQTRHMAMIEDNGQSRGKIYFKAPDLLKWEYETPYNYKLLFKNGELHIENEGKKSQAMPAGNKLFEKIGKLISASVDGSLVLDQDNFETTYTRYGDFIRANMKPGDPQLSRFFKEIELSFDGEGLLNSVKLIEEAGDYTHIEIRNTQINSNIPDSVFSLEK